MYGFLQPGGTVTSHTDLPHKQNTFYLTWAQSLALLICQGFLRHLSIQTCQRFLRHFVLNLKGTRVCCGNAISFLCGNSQTLTLQWSAREMHLRGPEALWRSIPCAFCVLCGAQSHGKDGDNEIDVLFKMGIQKTPTLPGFIANLFFFFKANSSFSASSPASVFPVCVPAAIK